MKSRFFYGVFVGFILGCLFFFGVMNVNAQTSKANWDEANAGQYYHGVYDNYDPNYSVEYNYVG
jgi:hypothetical protein